MSSYNFRIRCNLPETMRIKSEEQMIELHHPDPKIQLTLSASRADKIENARYLVIKGGTYKTEDAAMEAGRQCQQALMLTFTHIKLGADFGGIGRSSYMGFY